MRHVWIFPAIAIASTPAYAQELSFEQDTEPGRMPVIRVAPNPEGQYVQVADEELSIYFLVRGAEIVGVPPNSWAPKSFEAYVADGDTTNRLSPVIADSLSTNWKPYTVTFPYHDPFGTGVGNETTDPVALCNSMLAGQQGRDRERFRTQGGSVVLHDAYTLRGHAVYEPSTRLARHRNYDRDAGMSVRVTCLPIAAPGAARVRREVEHGSRGAEEAAERARGAPDIVLSAGFDISPAAYRRVGNQSCPAELRLTGAFRGGREAEVNAAFVGPGYVSAIEQVSVQPATTYRLERTYPVKWEAARGAEGAYGTGSIWSQTVELRFNIARGENNILASEEQRYVVRCRPERNTPNREGERR